MHQNGPESLQMALFGPFSLSAGDHSLTPGGDKVRALLAFIAMQPGQAQRREALMTLFWPELELDAAQTNLRQAVYRLRQRLPEAPDRDSRQAVELLSSDRSEVAINPRADLTVDVLEFRRLLDEVRAHHHTSIAACAVCREKLETAVGLYRGDFLSDLYLLDSNEFEDWSAGERAALQQQVLDALKELTNAYMAQGQLARAEPVARRQIAIDPLREGAYRQLMTLLARDGRKAEALAVYEACRAVLDEELGVEPSAATRALHGEILAGKLEKPAPDQSLDAYQLRGELGRGAFGVIYRAYQPGVDREIALKVIAPEMANKPDFLRRLEREARLVARLEHPHVVPIYGYWRDEQGAYLAMRLLPGSLRDRVEAGPLEADLVLRLLDQFADALTAVHQLGIVHRDLKPANILLDEHNNAYLTDFGLAKDLSLDARQSTDETPLGSPAYAAPEQLRGEPVTPRTDIYSLGIILYELLAGKLPFEGHSLAAVIQHQLSDPLPPLNIEFPKIPPAVDRVLARATAKRPEDRYPDVLSLAADFRKALSEALRETAVVPLAGLVPDAAQLAEAAVQRPVFVAREGQLSALETRLASTIERRGEIVCITGGAGRGKSALLSEFAHRAMAEEPQLLVAMGSCNTFSAAGDPYLPFRELLAVLTADVESRLRTGVVSPEHARRLWTGLPQTVEALVEHGPDLIGSLLPAGPLLARARSAAPVDAPWMADLQALAGRAGEQDGHEPDPGRLFSHVTAVFQALSQVAPLLLILDDLQWIDQASAALLFHLCRRLYGQRIMIACAYRPDEVAAGREGDRHPLQKILAEVKRDHGSVWINLADLSAEEGLAFVNALLDEEDNRLDESFRLALYLHTGGHPLFTVELLRSLRDQGSLQQDEDGRWAIVDEIDWHALPARVEGVIEERIGRLEPRLRDILTTASVEGELFTAQVVARVEDLDERATWRALSHELQEVHNLIQEQEEVRVGRSYLARYRFRHALFQQYLYDSLGRGEKRLIHSRVGEALQALLGKEWQPFAAALAWHFQEADLAEKAVPCWLYLGDQARSSYALVEAEQTYGLAVKELRRQNRQEEAARTLMKLGLVYTAAFEPEKAQQAYSEAFALWEPSRAHVATVGMSEATGTLRLALERPSSLDPGLLADEWSLLLAAQLFEGLVQLGPEQNILPAVARRWEVLDGGQRYRFHLDPNRHWSDGRPVTAADFVFAWRRNLEPGRNAPSAHLLYALRNARAYADGEISNSEAIGAIARDEHTLDMILEAPSAYLPYLLADPVAYPLPGWAIEQHGDAWTAPGNLVSNGPFRLSMADDAHLLLSRNPHYGGTIEGNIGSLEIEFFADHQQALHAYQENKIDAVSLLRSDAATVYQALTRHGEELLAIPRSSTQYVMFRCDKPPFDNRLVRQAFAHAVDRRSFVDTVSMGLRQPALGGFVPPGMAGHTGAIGLSFDPKRAAALLDEAGYDHRDEFPDVEWAVASPGGEQDVAFLQQEWQGNLGLQISPQILNWEHFRERLDQDPAQITLLGWAPDLPDPYIMLGVLFHSRKGFNRARWQNDGFDTLIDRAQHTPDHQMRTALFAEADRILVAEDTVVLPLSYARGYVLVKPRVALSEGPVVGLMLRAAKINSAN